jgi:uncharacterized RDD family membrane protein YckC
VSDFAWALTQGTIWRRIVAFVIDGIIVLVLVKAFAVVVVIFGIATLGLGLPLLALLPAVPVFYNWLSVMSGLSATPGQALMGLVVRRDEDLGAPGAFAALVWVIGCYISLALSGIPLLLALFTARRRTAHDVIAGLVVVRAEALTTAAWSWNMRPGGPPFT